MILITSTGEISFIFLFTSLLAVFQFFSMLVFFLVNITLCFFGRFVFLFTLFGVCSVLAAREHVSVGKKSRRQTSQTQSPIEPGLNLNYDQMEHLEGEQYSQYPMERNPRASRSMRDY